MALQALQALNDPDAFFERASDDSGLGRPAVLVVSAGLLGVVDQVLLQQKLQAALPSGAGNALGALVSLAGAAVRPLLAWLVVAAAFHVISDRFGGDGSFGTTTKLVGWGFLPALAFAGLSTIVGYVAISAVPAPSSPEEMAAFFAAVNGDGLVTVTGYLSVVFTLWQGFMWTFAVRTARGLSLGDAARTVAGPVAVLVAWTAYLQVAAFPRFLLGIPFARTLLAGGGPV